MRYSNMAFGQGLDVTMVQVCAAFSTIINGGVYFKPTVIAGTMSDDGKAFSPAQIKEAKTGVIGADALEQSARNDSRCPSCILWWPG